MVSATLTGKDMGKAPEPEPEQLTEADEAYFAPKGRNVRLNVRLFYILHWIARAENKDKGDILDEEVLDQMEDRYEQNQKLIEILKKSDRERNRRRLAGK